MVSTCDFDSQNSSSILLPSAIQKPLVYNNVIYSQFLIDVDGNVLNTRLSTIGKDIPKSGMVTMRGNLNSK